MGFSIPVPEVATHERPRATPLDAFRSRLPGLGAGRPLHASVRMGLRGRGVRDWLRDVVFFLGGDLRVLRLRSPCERATDPRTRRRVPPTARHSSVIEMSSPRSILRGVSFVEVVGTLLVMAAGGVALAQQQPAAPAPSAAPGKPEEPPSFEVVLTHVLPAGTECAPRASGVCCSLAHWQATVTIPAVDAPAVVPLEPIDDLLRLLRDAKKEEEEPGGTSQFRFAKNLIVIRAPSR